ncbi:BadF/BadG/BcrA/BcrD ATPase family protein [Actinomadura sp. DC4]|uniref:N-acetylglucosamine kinase n=1 Tax=Actinomadura sp. DC4 TaxID=3055069 RepID=UPI0025B05027|nr:BadF/BadG/BcrA/BcrD ATPase family protein [Actinomadura sp. DC4]MDN3355567.1 BadF/BadG/BcrA/BcrD ATPase family protein [Actinomadura sp. DC4]
MRSNPIGPYVVGVDAGGTRTRAAIITLDGTVVGYGAGPGANPNSGGGTSDELTHALTTALTAAIEDLDPALVAGGVFGIAGAGSANRPRAVASAGAAWQAAGIAGEPEVITDIPVAFAAGSTEPVGIVVFAGTGAGAAVINAGEIERRADANGYLIGDEGSAVWIGREAVRAVMRACDGRGRATILADTVPRALLGEAATPLLAGLTPGIAAPSGTPTASLAWCGTDLAQAIIKKVYAGQPAAIGGVAPLVSAAAEAGDPVALEIIEGAVRHLLEDADAVRPALDGREAFGVVVAGSLLESGPVADGVRAGLYVRFGVEPVSAGDGALGAARLAVHRLER